MKSILFYGNCQIHAIYKTLNMSSNDYTSFVIPCWNDNINKEYFTDIINKCDIIITQPVNDNYRDVDYLSTNYIINNSRKDCIIILFDSCYFNFYYFDLTYKFFNNSILNKPIDYHYTKMIECYTDNKSINYYIENYVNNEELKTYDELDIIAENSLNELKLRYTKNKEQYNKENIYIITTHEFIKNNYKDILLFYSMNHPTKYIIQYICSEIITVLNEKNTIDYNIELLDNTKCIIYKCIKKNVNFNIEYFEALTLNKTNIVDITHLYYDAYKDIGYSLNA